MDWSAHIVKLEEALGMPLREPEKVRVAQFFETYFGNYELQRRHWERAEQNHYEQRARAAKAELEVTKLRKELGR